MDNGRRFLLFFLISKMNGFLYLCLLHFKKKMEQEDFNIREHQLTSRERDFENALRPLSFEDFSGQDKVVENLRIFEGGTSAWRSTRPRSAARASRIG